jgi:transcriptional regulator with GAF, ATPase, and Fis domain
VADEDHDESPAADVELARVFAEIARTLLAEETLPATLIKICSMAVTTVDGCDHAGITLVQARAVSTEGASDDVPERVDAVQYETGEGPCLDAIRDHEVFQTDDLAEESRWPNFAQRAVDETGVHSMLCFRLFAESDTMGALNLYSKQTSAFADEAREVGAVFAAHAAVAMSSAKEHEQMEAAIQSRDVIGQAKGMLMAREGITEDAAFNLLRRASQRLNMKLRDVAEAVSAGRAPVGQDVVPGERPNGH